MSKPRKSVLITVLLLIFGVVEGRPAVSDYLEAEIRVDPAASSATISGKWANGAGPRHDLSFLTSAVGAPELGKRISGVVLKDANGAPVPFRAFNPAEYVAEKDFLSFSYSVDLRPLPDRRSSAHASWLGESEGLIMLDDLLPLAPPAARPSVSVAVSVAGNWQAIGPPDPDQNGRFRIADVSRVVFILGKELRQPAGDRGRSGPSVVLSGRWLFDDREASNAAQEVFYEYSKIFGSAEVGKSTVLLIPLRGAPSGIWEAETRGSTVVIASSDMPFKTQSVQRLHEQLRHEIFHLWLPNGVDLSGRYDWFYEGFALYQSVKLGVALNQIRFEDMLDTLSRAHAIDSASTRRSLIEASRERWGGAETQVYARGMIVAFLSDLVLLQRSNGKRSVAAMLAKLFSGHRPPAVPADGNSAVLALFDDDPALSPIASDYIRGAKPVAWASIIDAAGLEEGPGGHLQLKAKISSKQKALLDKLGYNSWRKLTLR